MDVFLETERLLLRRFTEFDVDNLAELDSDPEVMRYLNGGIPTPREVIEREVLPRFLHYYAIYDAYGFWAAIEKSTSQFVGWFCLHPEDDGDDRRLALGYRLRKAAWGKGYATEGSKALIAKGFGELGARRIFATTYERNRRSWRVMEKAGMKLARTYRMTPQEVAAAGTFVSEPEQSWEGNDVEYAIDREEWERGKRPC
ncbi:MAG: GNAT family N-acetyltransferase [Chloroflexota bacterium]